MQEIIPGLCYPELVFLLFSMSGVLLVLLNSTNRDANLMGFFIFIIISMFSVFISGLCHINYVSLSWTVLVAGLFSVGYLVNNKYIGKIDLMEFFGMMISNIYTITKNIFNSLNKIL